MKVAYNNCFGGFGLSLLALTKFAEKKGIALTLYVDNKRVEGMPEDGHSRVLLYTVDHGEILTSEASHKDYYYPDLEGEVRKDPDLISIIEELGHKADGMCASLAIQEIPDGASFEIDEYDGNETVVPPRQIW